MHIIDLDKIEQGYEDLTIKDLIQVRIEHIMDALEVLNREFNISETEEYNTISYHAQQILRHLEII
jgi:hypothetical protein